MNTDWRQHRWDTNDFLLSRQQRGKTNSPINVFGVFTYLFRIDWLYAVDQGVGADFLGNFFVLLMQKMPGNTMEERVHHIWEK